ncbi:metal ABC transporter substrate-binding protein [Lacrimispora saccharolytica]|uniref:Periplasmic solute binding protein n=1 Tax=Lacrimispora saccharolytica (strain ATCC 35040 / DSM 2544 / NRCC 2533 / WM1) TaxID=610130 RepID=D9R0Y8_LACSW|nr:metal ABC transporter substrate-binding protein [Lacrimispora saccharolytica]ADL02787.1 periplasmic solute binding protein [[Clostridium] saccharolyticum WM1]QRV19002.1 zinc ABC transporter substrate-binding protein [Lacrimispora saccharolytica]
MKKLFMACLLTGLLLIGALTACSSTNAKTSENDKLRVVCTIFPEYDWVREILGSHAGDVEITMLLDNGVDLHSYQPTAEDIIKISNCDMFIYVGGESDQWVEDALKEAANKNMTVINLLEVLGDTVKEEEMMEGMEPEEEEHDQEGVGEGPEYDEHVWLSLKNAKTFCNYIASKLGEIDSANAGDYSVNADTYEKKLDELDKGYQQTVDSAQLNTVLFGDRFPFRYLADDYGLSYYAAFAGCSAETEASFETIAFLSKKVDELGLKSVLTIEGTKHKIAETIIQNTKDKNQTVRSMDSMQSTTSKDMEHGATYLSIMQTNLDVLKEALK